MFLLGLGVAHRAEVAKTLCFYRCLKESVQKPNVFYGFESGRRAEVAKTICVYKFLEERVQKQCVFLWF